MGPGTNAVWRGRHGDHRGQQDRAQLRGAALPPTHKRHGGPSGGWAQTPALPHRPLHAAPPRWGTRPSQALGPSGVLGAHARPAPLTPARSPAKVGAHAPARPSGPTTDQVVQEAWSATRGGDLEQEGAHEMSWADWCSLCSSVTNSCPTPRNPTDCSPLDSSVHGRLQARILQRAAVSCFRASCQPRDLTHVSCTGRRVLYHRATWEAFSAPYINLKMESPCHPTAPLLTMLSGKDEN